MIEIRLAVQPDAGHVECGDPAPVRLSWSGADRGARELRVSAVAETVSGDEREVIARSDPPVIVPVSDGAGEATFSVTIPAAGPPSHAGTIVSVQWRLEAVIDLVRARDPSVLSDPFVVWPGGWRLRDALDRAAPPSPDAAGDHR